LLTHTVRSTAAAFASSSDADFVAREERALWQLVDALWGTPAADHQLV
jgi:hypothetical protein